jgi:hypothetical protein
MYVRGQTCLETHMHSVTVLAHTLISVNLKNYQTYRKRAFGTKYKWHISFSPKLHLQHFTLQ